MEAILYAGPGGIFVLMPGRAAPGQVLEQASGPFVPCGQLALADIDRTPMGRRIRMDFDHYGHSLLAAGEADELFGANALWGFSDQRRTPRHEQPPPPPIRWRRLASTAVGERA